MRKVHAPYKVGSIPLEQAREAVRAVKERKTMRYYMLEYTDWVRGSMGGRDDGQPLRQRIVGTDRHAMLRKLAEKNDGKGYRWEAPKFYELVGGEVPVDLVLEELDEYEKTKNLGENI